MYCNYMSLGLLINRIDKPTLSRREEVSHAGQLLEIIELFTILIPADVLPLLWKKREDLIGSKDQYQIGWRAHTE